MSKLNIKELFDFLSESKKKSENAEELQTVTVRLPPELGLMLKVLSSDRGLNFPVSTTFTGTMSYSLRDLIIARSCMDESDPVCSINEFIDKVSSNPEFIENSKIENAMILLEKSELLKRENALLHALGLLRDNSDSTERE